MGTFYYKSAKQQNIYENAKKRLPFVLSINYVYDIRNNLLSGESTKYQ